MEQRFVEPDWAGAQHQNTKLRMCLKTVNPAIKSITAEFSTNLLALEEGTVVKYSAAGCNKRYAITMNIQALSVTAQISRRNTCSSSLPRTSW